MRLPRNLRCALGAAAAVLAACGAWADAPAPPCPPAARAPSPAQVRAAQEAVRDRGLLWRLDRDGRTSYLYGTLHLGRLDWATPGPTVARALAATDALALELDLTDPGTLQALSAATADGPPPLPLPPALRERLARQAAAACLGAHALDGLHPVMQTLTLVMMDARWEGLDASAGQELVLARAAQAHRLPIVALESPTQQVQALIPRDPARALELVSQALDQLESGASRRAAARLAHNWAEGRLADLEQYERWCECVADERDRAVLRLLNDERNPRLADRIEALHADGRRVFAAVGALHMTGPKALPGLLEQRGFVVDRMPLPP